MKRTSGTFAVVVQDRSSEGSEAACWNMSTTPTPRPSEKREGTTQTKVMMLHQLSHILSTQTFTKDTNVAPSTRCRCPLERDLKITFGYSGGFFSRVSPQEESETPSAIHQHSRNVAAVRPTPIMPVPESPPRNLLGCSAAKCLRHAAK